MAYADIWLPAIASMRAGFHVHFFRLI